MPKVEAMQAAPPAYHPSLPAAGSVVSPAAPACTARDIGTNATASLSRAGEASARLGGQACHSDSPPAWSAGAT